MPGCKFTENTFVDLIRINAYAKHRIPYFMTNTVHLAMKPSALAMLFACCISSKDQMWKNIRYIDRSRKFRKGTTRSLISFGSHLDNKDVPIHSMTPYPSYMPVSLLSKLFDFSLIGSRFSGVFAATAKSRPPHPACLHFMASTTSRGVVHLILPIISRSPESLDAHYLSYNNMPNYSYAPNLSVHMHTINNSQRERSQ